MVAGHSLRNNFNNNKKEFDVIFIDGLHIYEQCRKDIINSLKVLNKNPETLVYPIAIRGDKAVMAHTFSDILKLIKPDSSDVKIP